jgi:NAD(P)-dependent dehydrogenase (short-subunit alcohol dehydrogenase family)
MDFSDKHVIVTGGAGALGIAVVGALIAAKAHCHVPYIHADEAERFPHRAHPNVSLIASGDLSDEVAVGRIYAAVPNLWASIHLAGAFAADPADKTSKAELMTQLNTNFVTCYLCCSAATAFIKRTGRGGRIVNVAARAALEWRAGANMTAYAASKAAVAAFTGALAHELAKANILVNAVAPSTMDTPANRKSMPDADHTTWPKVEDVAATILFLASPENTITSGAVVPVYGRA